MPGIVPYKSEEVRLSPDPNTVESHGGHVLMC